MLADISAAQPAIWFNPLRSQVGATNLPSSYRGKAIDATAIATAKARFERFAPLLAEIFPELASARGTVESELLPIPSMQSALGIESTEGSLWLKGDHSLPVAGSVKARGGFHEVFEFAERLAIEHHLVTERGDYRLLAQPKARQLYSGYEIAVGSTGNLGMSIGVMAAALGFRATVHMSSEAKEWKKTRLRLRGVDVVEHVGDYEQAVAYGRSVSESNPKCHFVDDEHSESLFLGYSVAAFHLKHQLLTNRIRVDAQHPLVVYIPCGVGGAPAGIAWGLHHVFGGNVHCFFAEPVQSPCFLVRMLADDDARPSVYDIGLNNRTIADGLAVPRASELAAMSMESVVAGVFTVEDATLIKNLKLLHQSEGIQIEPSAAAGFSGPVWLRGNPLASNATTHVVWTTGGALMPESELKQILG